MHESKLTLKCDFWPFSRKFVPAKLNDTTTNVS